MGLGVDAGKASGWPRVETMLWNYGQLIASKDALDFR